VSAVTDTFPRQHARTRGFTLGEPRNLTVSRDGHRIVYLRSSSGSDPVNSLWVMDALSGEEALVADPRVLLADDGGELPDAERARRERARERAAGITAYATDARSTVAAFAVDGRLFTAGLISRAARPLPVEGPVFDPRPDPLARRLAYVRDRELRIAELDGSSRSLVGGSDEPDTVSWGSADFIAAEEMHRFRGYWWSPDGESLAVCRVDTAPVGRWTIADPANPDQAARQIAYPQAGSANAEVTLHVIDLDGERREVRWDRDRFPYLADVAWTSAGLVLQVQSRDQRGAQVLRADPDTGVTLVMAGDADDAWVELVPGAPRLRPDGTLVTVADRDGSRRLVVDGEPVTPATMQVRSVLWADEQSIGFQAGAVDDATSIHVWRLDESGLTALTDEPGVHTAAGGGGTVVIRSALLDEPGARFGTLDGVPIASHAERPLVAPNISFAALGGRSLATAVLLPHDHDGSPLPVLLDPYGGPHAQRATRAHNAHLTSQWFADQGFAVVVIDGRGTPGRGAAWERSVRGDLASAPLEDQVDGLHAAAEQHPELDLGRVAIRGWSFGGYLAALAVMRRPDVFHAAVAGAPVTDWSLYDTHYTERYLGDPAVDPDAYAVSSLIEDAPRLTRPLLLIHGLADDNVVAAHTLRLSAALLAAGRPHEVLPLVGVTHMASQEEVAENLLLHQLDFLRRSLPDPTRAEDVS
jgi:dipeptidyl-peptidase-4